MITQGAKCKMQGGGKRITRLRRPARRPTFLNFDFSSLTSSQGFSLAELLVVISISSVLFLSLSAALSGTLNTTVEVAAQLSSWHMVSSALLQMERELALATQVVFTGDTRISFSVPDITGDGAEDLVAYSWDGSDGAPLVRAVNGGSAVDLLPEVRDVRFSYNYREGELHGIATATKNLDVVAASFDEYTQHSFQSLLRSITSSWWRAQSFVPVADTHHTDSVEFNLRAGSGGMFGVGSLRVALTDTETDQELAWGLLMGSDIEQADTVRTFTIPMIWQAAEGSGLSTEHEYRWVLSPFMSWYAGEVERLMVTDPEGPDNYMKYEWSNDQGASFKNMGNMSDVPFLTHGTYVIQYGVNAEHTEWSLGRVSIHLKYGSGKNEVAVNSAVRLHNAK